MRSGFGFISSCMNLAIKTDNIVIAYRPESTGFVPERDFSDRDFPTGTRSGAMDNDFCDFSHIFPKYQITVQTYAPFLCGKVR